jgi:hypothetical protein
MTVQGLAGYLASAERDSQRWRLVAEFLEEYRHEPQPERAGLLAQGRIPVSSDIEALCK